MDVKAARRMELFSQYAVAAALEAKEDAAIDMEQEDVFRVGVMIGSGVGSLATVELAHEKIVEKGPGRVSPMMIPLMISNMAAGNVSIQLGARGKCTNVVTACASGTHCIGDAFRAIQYGDADVIFAGGTESAICPTGVAGFSALTALSTSTDPMRASIPFDKDRDGFVLGEGAGSGSFGRIGAREKAWRKNLCRAWRIWSDWGCLSYHFSDSGWKRRSKGYASGNGRSRCDTGTGGLYQCTWHQYPSQ